MSLVTTEINHKGGIETHQQGSFDGLVPKILRPLSGTTWGDIARKLHSQHPGSDGGAIAVRYLEKALTEKRKE